MMHCYNAMWNSTSEWAGRRVGRSVVDGQAHQWGNKGTMSLTTKFTMQYMCLIGEESSLNICLKSGGSGLQECGKSCFPNQAEMHFYGDMDDKDDGNCRLHGKAGIQDE